MGVDVDYLAVLLVVLKLFTVRLILAFFNQMYLIAMCVGDPAGWPCRHPGDVPLLADGVCERQGGRIQTGSAGITHLEGLALTLHPPLD